jgi:hypothetical protein
MVLTDFSLEQLEGIMYIIGGVFAIVLFSLSFYAYTQSHAKRILYASLAFIFIFIYVSFETVETFFPVFDSSFPDTITASIITLVLILFFLAMVKN